MTPAQNSRDGDPPSAAVAGGGGLWRKMTRKARAWLAGGWVVGLGACGFFLSIPISRANDSGESFEIQVVLGGNTCERSAISHALWLRHPTPILVTGDEDYTRNELLRLGIPAAAIIHEPLAQSTWQNAAFSVPMLRQRNVKAAVIVTSWFHSSRAYDCFAKAGGGITFTVCTAPTPSRMTFDYWRAATKERAKKIGYWMKHGMNPWASGK